MARSSLPTTTGAAIRRLKSSPQVSLPLTIWNPRLCALLNPGDYTAIVRGVNDTTGIALVEVYQLPN